MTDRDLEDFAAGPTFGHLPDAGPSGRGTRLASFTERFEVSAVVAAVNWKWR
jgi:hypothetical protein